METAISCGHGMGLGYSAADRWRFPPWMAFSRRGRPGGTLPIHSRNRDLIIPPFGRGRPHRPRARTINSDFEICDCPIVCYLSMAIALILIGCLLTAFVLDDTFGHLNSMISQLWLVGPLFISSGVVFFIRIILFLRKKQAQRRQREELRRRRRNAHSHRDATANPRDLEAPCSRRDSFSSLPPDYEAVVNGVGPPSVPRHHQLYRHGAGRRNPATGFYPGTPRCSAAMAFLNLEEPPPAYEDVVRTVIIMDESACPPYPVEANQCLPENISTIQREVCRLSCYVNGSTTDSSKS
ncbi:uncharacterized protein LOC129596189 [Paramacrobiotus metropolitanus]|uniref:uncharacterized protein LOC129596189 n=1 Tax=Paramacrobiotus metropolitanus TaxID=2943436 RepID=UPI002445E302|nr:uncharacterized protein LOC129596189 [Paramacrobiotus metropolitanus]XP_055349377.1 uncharacterized protein LOC129596189 [Paramacrobiotus metropolitanus]XP_055349385.1 uncharacterized protein LOC129596189 [Paramacrobiotus metropolitanus]XP_055349394.1 uncharacterized protein LOC129596189 [Paramacrobiotus metropolitanus]